MLNAYYYSLVALCVALVLEYSTILYSSNIRGSQRTDQTKSPLELTLTKSLLLNGGVCHVSYRMVFEPMTTVVGGSSATRLPVKMPQIVN